MIFEEPIVFPSFKDLTETIPDNPDRPRLGRIECYDIYCNNRIFLWYNNKWTIITSYN